MNNERTAYGDQGNGGWSISPDERFKILTAGVTKGPGVRVRLPGRSQSSLSRAPLSKAPLSRALASEGCTVQNAMPQISVTGARLSARAAGASVLQSLSTSIRSLFAGLREYRRIRRAECDLETFDDRMLRDIGIGRSEIRWVVRNGRGF